MRSGVLCAEGVSPQHRQTIQLRGTRRLRDAIQQCPAAARRHAQDGLPREFPALYNAIAIAIHTLAVIGTRFVAKEAPAYRDSGTQYVSRFRRDLAHNTAGS